MSKETSPFTLLNDKINDNGIQDNEKRSEEEVQSDKNVEKARQEDVRGQSEEVKPKQEPQLPPEQEEQEQEGGPPFGKKLQEEEAEGNDEPEVKVEVEGNLHTPVAEVMKANGYLPEDYEIPEDLTDEQLEEAIVENYKKKAESRIKGEMAHEMQQYGVDPKLAELNKIKSYGVTEDELNKLHSYNQIVNADVDKDSEDFEDYVSSLGKAYFKSRNIEEDDIEDYVETDLAKYGLEKLHNKYKKYFEKEFGSLQETISSKVETGKAQQKEQERAEQQELKSKLDKGEIDGRKYSDEQISFIKDALFNKSETLKDQKGNYRKVTRLEKLQHELQSNPEKELRLLADFLLGYDYEANVQEGKIKGKRTLINSLNKSIKAKRVDTEETDEKFKVFGQKI